MREENEADGAGDEASLKKWKGAGTERGTEGDCSGAGGGKRPPVEGAHKLELAKASAVASPGQGRRQCGCVRDWGAGGCSGACPAGSSPGA